MGEMRVLLRHVLRLLLNRLEKKSLKALFLASDFSKPLPYIHHLVSEKDSNYTPRCKVLQDLATTVAPLSAFFSHQRARWTSNSSRILNPDAIQACNWRNLQDACRWTLTDLLTMVVLPDAHLIEWFPVLSAREGASLQLDCSSKHTLQQLLQVCFL